MTPVIGKKHILRNGEETAVIVSSVGVCESPERYPYMEEGNTDPVACWALKGQWDDRGSEWPKDIVAVAGEPTCDLYVKPERFGDGDTIYLRQYKVSVTSDLKTVTGHAVTTEAEMWIPGWGVTHVLATLPKAPAGLELIDQSLPLGSPWPVEERKPHVPVRPKRDSSTRLYPGPLSIFAGLFGNHTPEMTAAFDGYGAWCQATGAREDTGSWSSTFCKWLRSGSQRDSELWDKVGFFHATATEHALPMVRLIRAHFEAEIKPWIPAEALEETEIPSAETAPPPEDFGAQALDILRRLIAKGCVDDEGDFLLGDTWPDEGCPKEPAVITEAIELFERMGAPLKVYRNT